MLAFSALNVFQAQPNGEPPTFVDGSKTRPWSSSLAVAKRRAPHGHLGEPLALRDEEERRMGGVLICVKGMVLISTIRSSLGPTLIAPQN